MYADFDHIPTSFLTHTEMIFQADDNDLLCLWTALSGECKAGGSIGLTMAYEAGALKSGTERFNSVVRGCCYLEGVQWSYIASKMIAQIQDG